MATNVGTRPFVFGALVSALVLVVLVPLLMMGFGMGTGMMGMMAAPGMMWRYGAAGGAADIDGWRWGLVMVVGGLARLAFWAALIASIVMAVRWIGGMAAPTGRDSGDAALDVLRQRYASGDITEQEYEQRRQVLQR